MEYVLAAASATLGTPLVAPVPLAGGGRTTVLRCRTGDGGTVVVKAYRPEPDALSAFTAEAAALAFGVAGPRLLAVDPGTPLIVMEDLGDAPSVADLLLGGDAEAAHAALLDWAGGLGRLCAGTVGREPELAALRERYDRGHPAWHRDRHVERCARLPGLLADLGSAPPAGLDEDLAEVLAVADPAHYPVFSPGDTCPDNNLLTAGGLRVLDFELASYHCVFLDAAYPVMPFATCWCVFRLPAAVADQITTAFRTEVVRAYPALADDTVWWPGVRRAVAAWTINLTTLLLPGIAGADRPAHADRRPVATWRQILRYRWRFLADLLAAADELPAVAAAMRSLLAATGGWGVGPLPFYPPWR